MRIPKWMLYFVTADTDYGTKLYKKLGVSYPWLTRTKTKLIKEGFLVDFKKGRHKIVNYTDKGLELKKACEMVLLTHNIDLSKDTRLFKRF